MLISPVQPLNAEEPIFVMLLGIVMLVSPVQPLNAEEPIFVILLGIVMLVSSLQKLNAFSPIFVTLYSFPLYITIVGIFAEVIFNGCFTTVAILSFKEYRIPSITV